MTRVTLAGPGLEGFDPGLPAASVRLLLPDDSGDLAVPTWRGNEFLLGDGSRPVIRTVTPTRFDPARLELDVEIVRHGNARLPGWADTAAVGDQIAVAGTGRGYQIDPAARAFVVAGDESALPAVRTIVPALPQEAEVQVIVEIRDDDARLELPAHPGMTVVWLLARAEAPPGESLVTAVEGSRIDPDARVWAAGEAAAVHRIRRDLFEDRAIPRSNAVVRGYWKVDRDTER